MPQINAPWQIYLIFATLLGLGLGSHDVVTLSTIGRWFSTRRGIMTGLVERIVGRNGYILCFVALLGGLAVLTIGMPRLRSSSL